MTYSTFWETSNKLMLFMSAAGPLGPFILGLGWHPNKQKHRGPAVHCLQLLWPASHYLAYSNQLPIIFKQNDKFKVDTLQGENKLMLYKHRANMESKLPEYIFYCTISIV